MQGSSSKRRSRQSETTLPDDTSVGGSEFARLSGRNDQPPSHEWDKDDEELELEERLFGKSRKRTKGDSGREVEGRNELADVDDEDLFTIDAPLAADMPSDLEDDSGDEDDSRSFDDDEGSASEEEDLGTDDESEDDDDVPEFQIDTELDNGEGTRNGHHENDDEDNGEVEVDYEEGYEEDGPNAPSIFVPPNVVDIPSRPRARASSSASASSSGSSGSEDDGRAVNKNKNKSKSKGKATSKPKGKQPLWLDPADQLISVDLENDKRLRKLARGVNGSTVKGKELEKRLRQQYESIHPRPDWADQRSHAGVASLSSLLSSTKSFIDDGGLGRGTNGKGKGKNNGGSGGRGGGGHKPRSALAPGELDIQRLRNANQQNPTAGKRDAVDAGDGVVDLAWHPSERVGVLAVAGGDRRVRFFNIDGHTNPTLMTLHIPSLPLSKATFHPSGSSILFTGSRPFYYTYDLASQRCLRSPRNLFGSLQTPSSPNSLHRHSFSPDGSMLAVAGRRGAVSVLDWSTAGVGAVVAELKSGRGGAVCGMTWSLDGRELSVLGGRDGAEVEVWNVGERRIVRKWGDDRAYGGSMMVQSRSGEYTAIGSSTGIVNVYSASSIRENSLNTRPDPVRSLEHLTTPITSLAFNPSSEILVTASQSKKGMMKTYHLPSLTAYQNFPTTTMPLKRVSSLGFSAGGEYFASGNQSGAVLLWRLKHYADM